MSELPMQDQKQNKIRWRKIFHSSANSLPLSRLWRKNGSSPKCSLLSLYLLARMPHKEILSLPFVTISCYPTQEQSCSLIFLIQWLKPFIPSHLLWYASIQQLLCTNLMLGMCVKEKSTSGFLMFYSNSDELAQAQSVGEGTSVIFVWTVILLR